MEEVVSLPEWLLDEPERCETHGEYLPCYLCLVERAEEYADQQIQDEKEG